MHVESVHVRKSGFQNPGIFFLWNPESGNVLLVEFGILGFGIRNTVQGIRNPTDDCNPESRFHWQNPVLGNRNPLLRIQNHQRPCWILKGKSGVRWGRREGGGGEGGSWLVFWSLTFVVIRDVLTQLTPETNCPRERRLWQPFPNYIPNLEQKASQRGNSKQDGQR